LFFILYKESGYENLTHSKSLEELLLVFGETTKLTNRKITKPIIEKNKVNTNKETVVELRND
jgi:hypothetical protein